MIRNPDNHMPVRQFRLGEEWDELGELVGSRKRSEILREFVLWYLRKPDAKRPARPNPDAE